MIRRSLQSCENTDEPQTWSVKGHMWWESSWCTFQTKWSSMVTFYCCSSRLRKETTSFLDWTFQSGQLADSVYHLQNVRLRRHRPVVHFNRLKLCPDDIHMPSPVPVQRQTRSNSPLPLGTNLSQVPQNDSQLPTLSRYSQRSRHLPTHLHPMVTH